MLRARQIFGTSCALILLAGCVTPQLQAQTPGGISYTISDNFGRTAVSCAAPIVKTNQGCGIYGSCASIGSQICNECETSQDCQDTSCCACSRCGIRHKLNCELYQHKRLEYFQYRPAPSCPGDRLYQLLGAQQANGRFAQLVFYNFHFNFDAGSGKWTLSRAGLNNVYKIARIWPSTPGTIVIEPTGNETADQFRMQVVQQSLADSGIQGNVTIGRTPAIGLTGVEANSIYQQRLQNAPLRYGPSTPSQSKGGN